MSDDDDVPAIEVAPLRQAMRRPVDAVARARYLEELARSGSHLAAAAAARPHLVRSKRSADAVMRAHMDSNPEFAAQVRDVLSHLAGRLQSEAVKRALEGVVVYTKKDDRGNVVEERRQYDNDLLLKMLREVGKKVDPTVMAPEERQIKVTGTVGHVHASIDMEKMMEGMSTEAIRQMMEAADAARLGPGDEVDVIDAEGEDFDPVQSALDKVQGREDDGLD